MGACLGSSVVELIPEEDGVVSSILTPGTLHQKAGLPRRQAGVV